MNLSRTNSFVFTRASLLFPALVLGLWGCVIFRLKTSGLLAEYWLFVLGALFIAVTLFLPKGVVGTWDAWRSEAKARRAASVAAEKGSDMDSGEPQAELKIVRAGARTRGKWRTSGKSGSEPQPAG